MSVVIDKDKLISKIKSVYGYQNTDLIIEKLLCCDDRLLINVKEWSDDMPLSDVWIRDKYCINAVFKIRNDNDFIDALISLDEFAKDQSKEFVIWRKRI